MRLLQLTCSGLIEMDNLFPDVSLWRIIVKNVGPRTPGFSIDAFDAKVALALTSRLLLKATSLKEQPVNGFNCVFW